MNDGELRRMPLIPEIMTTDDLLRRGKSPRQIQRLVARGALVRLSRGVYASAELAERFRQMPAGDAALRATGGLATSAAGTVASHQTAAQLHGLDLLTPPRRVTVTRLPGRGSKSGKPAVYVHTAAMPADHVGGRFGLPVTTVPRTVVDLARELDFAAGVVVADSALHQHLASKKELRQVLAYCHLWPGALKAARVIDFADGLAESVLESIARVLFQKLRLPPPELQVEIRSKAGFIGRVDFLWRQFRTIAEVDGALKYAADPMRARRQLQRDKELRKVGYEVEHFDWREITQGQQEVGSSLRATFARGRHRSAS
jgi:very-short-patch-repair endonuclease/predicted transcriptional regulator of viral defense system